MDMFTKRGRISGGNKMENENLKNKAVLDNKHQELGRVLGTEQELRTGRLSTLRVEVNSKFASTLGDKTMRYLPLGTHNIEFDNGTIKLRETVEELNRQFSNKLSGSKKEYSLGEVVEKPVSDKDNTPVGTIRDFKPTTNHGEFPTIGIELQTNVKKNYTSGVVDIVRVRTDRIDDVGQTVRLNRDMGELSREWIEIAVRE
jgi:sporulation protein YlmC with PRC-barrel domain